MKPTIERIVLPLDATAEIAAAIETAAFLAARWHVPLLAVFVEDEDLWHLAGLPFARQVSVFAGGESLNREQIAVHFRAFEVRLRDAVAVAASRHRVEWSFATVHGTLAAVGLGLHDFVVAGAASRPIGRHFRLPRRSRRSPDSPRSLLRVRRQWQSAGSVLAIVPRRDAAAARLLTLAAEIAGFGTGRLNVLAAPDPASPQALAQWVAEILAGRSLQLTTEILQLDPDALRHRLAALDCRLVALPGAHAELEACFGECDVLTLGAMPS